MARSRVDDDEGNVDNQRADDDIADNGTDDDDDNDDDDGRRPLAVARVLTDAATWLESSAVDGDAGGDEMREARVSVLTSGANVLLLGLTPARYVLRAVRDTPSATLDAVLLALPLDIGVRCGRACACAKRRESHRAPQRSLLRYVLSWLESDIGERDF
jgi:hypothetical protein